MSTAAAIAGLVASTALLAVGPAGSAHAAFQGAGNDGVLAFASTGNYGGAGNTGGAQILYLASPNASHSPTSFSTPANVTTSGVGDNTNPFYSSDGTEMYFSSDNTPGGFWAIYSLPANTPVSPPATGIDNRVELSLGPGGVSGNETANDYGPSVDNTGETVVFARDNPLAIYQVPVSGGAPTGAPSVCYTPPGGLAVPSIDPTVGNASRVIFDPQDRTKMVYVDASYQLHLLSFPGPAACQGTPTDTALTTSSIVSGGPTNEIFKDPDWSPDGSVLILDTNAYSTPGSGNYGANILALLPVNVTAPVAAAPTPVWPKTGVVIGAGASSVAQGHEYWPVWSPDGNTFAFTEVGSGSQIEFTDSYNTSTTKPAPANMSTTDVTYQVVVTTPCTTLRGCKQPIASEPDWQPSPPGVVLPEAPLAVLLPFGGVGLAGLALVFQRRRRLAAPA